MLHFPESICHFSLFSFLLTRVRSNSSDCLLKLLLSFSKQYAHNSLFGSLFGNTLKSMYLSCLHFMPLLCLFWFYTFKKKKTEFSIYMYLSVSSFRPKGHYYSLITQIWMHSASFRVPSSGQTLSGPRFTLYNRDEQSAETRACLQCGKSDTFLPEMKGSVN